jgi:hypothetical protein
MTRTTLPESGPARSPAQKTPSTSRCRPHSGILDDRGPSSASSERSEATPRLRDRGRDQPYMRRSGGGGG